MLTVQPGVMVLDAAAMASIQPLPATQQEALAEAGLVVMNKSEQLDEAARQALAEQMKPCALLWTRHADLPLNRLPPFVEGTAVDKQVVDNLTLSLIHI
ncbi:hypothetical protein ALQ30_200213 [Pseudomonas syringae pv. persicae]|uniref:CobW/HypB/UreG nucleotide-binding domain-containing protein n=1 Tax=Pseudomonas syringae pv. persicae TaxID=237306 RepID=A0A3M3ZLB8_9PSED|nr:hypothetical protein ALQ30_200213 [Pseudomonas syringae pv. persicae]